MGLPLGDWQFWTVTACALGALWLLIRPFVGRSKAAPGACASCPKSAHVVSSHDSKSGGRDKLVTIGKIRS